MPKSSPVQKLSVASLADCGYRRPREEMEKYRLSHAASPPLPASISTPEQSVNVIPAAERNAEKTRVAAYCRVSTDEESQKSSIQSQQTHYEHLILSHPEWTLAGIYIDEGVSGTSADSRPELQCLLSDCREGKINLILTKSISRFARNLTECLSIIRELRSINVFFLFEKEHLHTGEMSSELMLSLLSCFAEEESRSISSNLKWSIRKRFQDGSFIPSAAPYGYRCVEGEMEIQSSEAAVIRQIFDQVLSGHGLPSIAQTLNDIHIPSPAGSVWTQSSIRSIVRNPAYTGDMLCQKTFTDEKFRSRVNTGQLDQYLYENHHPAIVSREMFEKAQSLIRQRASEVGYTDDSDPNRSSNRYPFTGKLFCKSCGSIMHRQAWSSTQVFWICISHKEKKCSMKPVSESDLQSAFITCLNKIAWSQKRKKWYNRILDLVPPSAEVTRLKRFVNRWRTTDDLSSFPEVKFLSLVAKCSVDTGKTVTFHFCCGLTLTESLMQTEVTT